MPDHMEPYKWLDSLPKRASSATLQLEDEHGQILIIKANYKPHWTFPGGVIDPGETPQQAAIRETLEEVGLEIAQEQVSFVSVANRTSPLSETYQFVFKAILQPGQVDKIVLQASEIDDYALVTRQDVAKGDRPYGQVIQHWAEGTTGYVEQVETDIGFR